MLFVFAMQKYKELILKISVCVKMSCQFSDIGSNSDIFGIMACRTSLSQAGNGEN